jgi:IMP dehydrogenase/GMP reductase
MRPSSSSVKETRFIMINGRGARRALMTMTDTDNDVIVVVTERFERRLSDENGKLRVDMMTEFGKVRTEMATELGKVRTEMATELGKVRSEMAEGFGTLRAEMIDRNASLLRWMLVFGITQTAAVVSLVKLWR